MSEPVPTCCMHPRLRTVEEIRAVSEATSKPLNVLARRQLSMSEIVAAGGHRISVGSWLTMLSVDAVVEAAKAMRDAGDFSSLRGAAGRAQRVARRADLVAIAGHLGEATVKPVA